MISFFGDGATLYVTEYAADYCAATVRAFDPTSANQRWQSVVLETEDHNDRWQRPRVEKLGDRLLFVVESSGGPSIEVVDPATGRVTSRIRPK